MPVDKKLEGSDLALYDAITTLCAPDRLTVGPELIAKFKENLRAYGYSVQKTLSPADHEEAMRAADNLLHMVNHSLWPPHRIGAAYSALMDYIVKQEAFQQSPVGSE